MRTGIRMLASFGMGAALMYLVDPRTGRRRRAMVRDGLTHAAHLERRVLGKAKRDLQHRVEGVVEQIRHPTSADPSDQVLVERVRAVVGRAAAHGGGVEVTVNNREVALAGPVLAAEAARLLDRVADVPGVTAVIDRLERHRDADSIPALQRQPNRRAAKAMLAPGPRLLVGGLGAMLVGAGFRQRGALGTLEKVLGATLVARAFANHPLRQLVGLSPLEVTVEKTITILAPRSTVFALWARMEDFPRFLEHVREVHVLDREDRRSRWVVAGPLGSELTFEARLTEVVQERRIAWTTMPGSPLEHSGTIHFEDADGGTRLHIQLRYRPAGGLLGHAFARLVGFDPRSRMHTDLVRVKALLEDGHTRVNRRRVELDELATH